MSLSRSVLTFLLVGLTVFAVPDRTVLAQAKSPAVTETEQALIESQQLVRFIDTLRKSLREPADSLAEVRKQFPNSNADVAWRRAVDTVMGKRQLVIDIARRQAAHLTAEEARAVVAFRRTPLGRKLTDAEASSPFPDDKLADQRFVMSEMRKASQQLDKDKARQQLLAAIFEEAGGGAMQTELMLTMSRGLILGMATAASSNKPVPTSGDIDQMIEQQRPQFAQLMRTIALPSLALSYRKLSNAELQGYLDWLRSPVGKKNMAGVIKAIATLLSNAGTDIGRQFGKDLASQRL